MTLRPIRFFHRATITELHAVPPTRTVLEWLREDQQLIGSKEGCAEGDCGACMVVLGEVNDAGQLALRPVNACIQFVPTLDGKALFTVEDLAGAHGALHPVQQSMVDQHGSQCGFCTPGFVMSLWALYQRHLAAGTRPTRQQLADDLSGNLCRCTGYRPILDAGLAMFEAPAVPLQAEPVLAALKTLASDPPLQTASGFFAPQTRAELAALLGAHPRAQLLAGSTDVGLWVNKQLREFVQVIYLGRVAEMQRIDEVDDHLLIGAGASLEAAWSALALHWPALTEVWQRFASLPIRQVGTMGGNVANGSPIGDSAPALMALGALIVLQRGAHTREMPMQDFYTGYMKNQLQAGEFVQALRVPLPAAGGAPAAVRVYKISKRFDCDISALCAAFSITLQGAVVNEVRLAFGGLAATVARATKAEAALRGQPWTEATLLAGMAALALDFRPLSDMRASSAYRAQVAQNLLRRFWLETRPDAALLAHRVSVFSRAA